MGARMNTTLMLIATSCLVYIGGHSVSAHAENFFDKVQHQADKLQEKLGKSAKQAQGPNPQLLGSWEAQVPGNYWQINVSWNAKENRYEGHLSKQGVASQAVGFAMGELVWKATPSGQQIVEEQEYRTGANGVSSGFIWRTGAVFKISNEEFTSSAARFIRVKALTATTNPAAPSATIQTATAATGSPVNSNVSTGSGAEIASSKSIEVDVVGLRLGMSTSEVEKIFKQRNLDNGIVPPKIANGDGRRDGSLSYKDISTGQYIKIKDSEYIDEFRGSKGRPYIDETLSTRFTPSHKNEKLVFIRRNQNFEANSNRQPEFNSLIKSLQDKYGSNMMKVGSYNNYVWAYNNEGKPLKNLEPQCLEFPNYDSRTGFGHINSDDFSEVEKKIKKCGSIFVNAQIEVREGFVKQLTVIARNMSLDLYGYKTARSIMLTAEKNHADRELEKSRARKPEL